MLTPREGYKSKQDMTHGPQEPQVLIKETHIDRSNCSSPICSTSKPGSLEEIPYFSFSISSCLYFLILLIRERLLAHDLPQPCAFTDCQRGPADLEQTEVGSA